MNFARFRRQITTEVFDYPLLANYLREFKKPRDKVSALMAEGKIIQLKKGLYLFGEDWQRAPLYLEMIANVIYGPSCVSFEYALSHYGMLAEQASVITSLAIGDSKSYHTPLGTFEYRAVAREKFKIGIEYQDLGKAGGYFIASKEKAIADLVYRTSGIRTLEHLRHYLFEEMRVDETLFRALNIKKLNEIAKVYSKHSVRMLSRL